MGGQHDFLLPKTHTFTLLPKTLQVSFASWMAQLSLYLAVVCVSEYTFMYSAIPITIMVCTSYNCNVETKHYAISGPKLYFVVSFTSVIRKPPYQGIVCDSKAHSICRYSTVFLMGN